MTRAFCTSASWATTYTVLLSGEQTAGRFALIDMLIPAGAGPPAHRHEFEECFHVVEGSVAVTLREDPPVRLWAEETVNIPANAPHAFRNSGDVPARLLCTAVPAGLEAFFAEFGNPRRFADCIPASAHGREEARASAARGRARSGLRHGTAAAVRLSGAAERGGVLRRWSRR